MALLVALEGMTLRQACEHVEARRPWAAEPCSDFPALCVFYGESLLKYTKWRLV
jgi:hypothetical protein